MNTGKVSVHETLPVGVLLALVGGYLDAYTYVLRGGVFANAQTGNMVLLAIQGAEGHFQKMLYYLVPILAFAAGVLVTEFIKKYSTKMDVLQWEQVILVLEILLLLIIGLLPLTVPHAVVNITISFVCAVQVCGFRTLAGAPYATTMCTGNLRSGTEKLFQWIAGRDREAGKTCGRYFLIIISFCAGAALGCVLSNLWQERAVWVCCVLLSMVLAAISLFGRRTKQ